VRRAGLRDIDELVRLRHAMFRAMARSGSAARPAAVEDTSWYSAAAARLREELESGRTAAFVVDASADSRVLAACAVASLEQRLPGPGSPRGLGGSMSSVFVEPDRRGEGLGTAVVTAAVRWLVDHDAEIVDLHATPMAEPIYRALGFREPRSAALRLTP